MAVDSLSITFAALADPTRRAILARLAAGPATVKELTAPFAMSGPAVSKHLRVLERAGLIARGREAQWRPCRLEAAPLKEVAEWAENYRRFWDANFERLDEYLQHLKAKETDHGQRQIRLVPRRSRRRRIARSSSRASSTRRAGSSSRPGPTPSTSRTGCSDRKAGPCPSAKSISARAGRGTSAGAIPTAPRWRCAACIKRSCRPSGSSPPSPGVATGRKRSTR